MLQYSPDHPVLQILHLPEEPQSNLQFKHLVGMSQLSPENPSVQMHETFCLYSYLIHKNISYKFNGI